MAGVKRLSLTKQAEHRPNRRQKGPRGHTRGSSPSLCSCLLSPHPSPTKQELQAWLRLLTLPAELCKSKTAKPHPRRLPPKSAWMAPHHEKFILETNWALSRHVLGAERKTRSSPNYFPRRMQYLLEDR